MKNKSFFADVFKDMKNSAIAQHEVDKAVFKATKAASKATFEEAKCNPKAQEAIRQAQRDELIATANQATAQAEARINAAKEFRGN